MRRGKLGESLAAKAGLIKLGPKVAIDSITGTAKRRIPDFISESKLVEVKFGKGKVRLTNQIKDFVLFAKERGLQFILVVRQGADIDGRLLELARNNTIRIERIPK